MQHLQQWISNPRTVILRKAIFQVHLWSGIGAGLYVLLMSITGSILVYRNELYTAAARGADLQQSVPLGYRAVSTLLELHDDLLGGTTGRTINGAGALLVVALALTGLVVWWPGIASWRRSLIVHRGTGWRRVVWDLHSVIGFWSFGFILLFGLSGVYLGNPEPFQDLADRLRPFLGTEGSRIVDDSLYWLAYLHFGRINGIGIPCGGPGLCDSITKFIWAAFGLAPALMFVTGVVMWWNRVGRRTQWRQTRRTIGSLPNNGKVDDLSLPAREASGKRRNDLAKRTRIFRSDS
jgi:uncharacterized iron-regulated membrane protein